MVTENKNLGLLITIFFINYCSAYLIPIQPILVSTPKSRALNIGVGTLNLSDKAKEYVNQVLESNRLSYGPFLKKFETEFAKMHNAKFCVSSNSGTSALQVALQALKIYHNWSDGDEVIVPATTFVATSNIVLHNNMTPVFVDVEDEYYELDPTLLEQKITEKTRAIIVVHLFGQPCDMDPILEIAKKYNLRIIEDSCETMLATYKGRLVGTLGDIGCFSTYIAHLATTGVGGLSTTNNPEYAVLMRSLVNHGRDSIYISIDDDNGLTSEQLKEVIDRRFSFIYPGHSFRITELEGAIGVAQLEDLPHAIYKRRQNAQYLTDKLSDLKDKLQVPAIRPQTEHSFMMYPIVLLEEAKRDLVNYLENNGIETRDMLPLINQPVYKKLLNICAKDYPVSEWIVKNGFYVGCHQDLSQEHLDYISDLIHNYYNQKIDILNNRGT